MKARIGRDLTTAGYHLKAGGVIAYPTEGVFGLGCDPRNEAAIESLLDIKHRKIDKGLILIASKREQLLPFIAPLSLSLIHI